MSGTIRILGLDPGLSAMGWGVIAVSGSRLTHIAHGVIATKPALGLGLRLMELHRVLCAVIAEHGPTAIAVEQAFVAKDPQAALKIGHAAPWRCWLPRRAGWRLLSMPPTRSRNASSARAMPARSRCSSWSSGCCRPVA